MNYPAASGRGINPKKQKQYAPQAAGELTQKRLKMVIYVSKKWPSRKPEQPFIDFIAKYSENDTGYWELAASH